MIVVTGGAGFIGSQIVKGLNELGREDIIVVDDLTDGPKVTNLADKTIADYFDKDDFLDELATNSTLVSQVEAVFHQGACSSTVELDGKFMMKNNYEYSKKLLHVCLQNSIPFIYASSASVYGLNEQSAEEKINENPLNPYAYSKFLFDEYVRRILPSAKSQVVGLRYFNVYGPGESHKGRMSSVLYHFNQQLIDTGVVKLFAGTNGFDDGEQRRDFIYVDDVVAMNLWFWQHPSKNGIVNAGTGKAHSFNQAAQAVIDWHGKGRIEYIPFPKDLVGRYQFFTEANTTILREYFGYDGSFHDIFTGTKAYLDTLNAKG